MSSFKFVLNRKGVMELLNSGEMAGVIAEAADGVSGRAASMTGLDYETVVMHGKKRVNGFVQAGSAHAYYENLKNNTLIKALGGG